MAKGAATKTKPVKAVKAKVAKSDDADELSVLAAQTKALEDQERSKTGNQQSFISLVQGNSRALKEEEEGYIKGAKMYDYVIPSRKLVLGPELDITILGMFKLYQESPKKEKESDIPPIVGFWMPEDAIQIPLAKGENFNREFLARDGKIHVLSPTHWVYIYLHKHPEIDDALITFRSIGNGVYAELMKTVKKESSICTELRFKVGKQAIKSSFGTTNYYPKFEIASHNFSYKDGQIGRVKGGLDAAEVKELLARSAKSFTEYSESKLVGKRNVASLIAAPASRTAIAAGKAVYEEEEEEALSF